MSDYSEHFDQEAWDEWVEENLDEIEDEYDNNAEFGYYGER